MSRLNFELQKTATGSRARAARFQTLHNEVLTPLFMPVGTHATVRGQRFQGANRFQGGGWSGPYGPLSQRQHWFSPWNDPVPGGGMGISLPYGMRFGEWL